MNIISSDRVRVENTGNDYLLGIPDNSKEEIKIIFQGKGSIKVSVGKNSSARITELSKGFTNQKIELIVGENSVVNYISIHNYKKEIESFSNKTGIISKNAALNWLNCYLCEAKTNSETKTILKGKGSNCSSFSIVFGSGKSVFKINNEVIHKADKSKSDILAKIVLNGKSRAFHTGLIRINPNAVGCEGYQKSDTILLSEDAAVEAVPNLEIENNDVACSHGATISQVDEEKLFYMKSRGLDEKTAKKLIIEGFFSPFIEKLSNTSLKESVKKTIAEKWK
ncbi:SufD family Fe-S cluster assembly protein [Candidatus Woesearchaeota archaeon]|nr:MAG: SufD family Fe-S cluster assembly protein [Candidatus Woesearchaeota archaeon]